MLSPLPRAGLAVVVSITGCSSSGEWKPVSVATIPVMPAYEARLPPRPTAKYVQKAPAPHATPVAGDLPSDVVAVGEVVVCKERSCVLADLAPPKVAQGAAPVALWTERFTTAGNTLSTPRDGRIDVYGIVLRGEAKVRGVEQATGTTLGPWKAFRAVGGAVAVSATKPDTLVILAVASDGAPISELAQRHEKTAAWKERPKPLETRDLVASTDLAWAGGAFHARLGFEDGRASFGVLIGGKDAPVKAHAHDAAWELLAAVRADGAFALADGAGDLVTRQLADGGVVAVPKGARHEWLPKGTAPLVAVQMYAPPGPEQRFKELARAPK